VLGIRNLFNPHIKEIQLHWYSIIVSNCIRQFAPDPTISLEHVDKTLKLGLLGICIFDFILWWAKIFSYVKNMYSVSWRHGSSITEPTLQT
jgi:hypothetical protein